MKTHYPQWDITKSPAPDREEIVQSWQAGSVADGKPAEMLSQQYRQSFRRSSGVSQRCLADTLCGFFFAVRARTAKILDLGAGWGEFINNIVAAEKYAMDLNQDGG